MSEIKEQVLQASRDRLWLDQEVEAYYNKIANDFSGLEICELEQEAFRCVAEQERYLDEECLQLNAASNLPNPKVGKLQSGARHQSPKRGHPKVGQGSSKAKQNTSPPSGDTPRWRKARKPKVG